MAFDIQRNRPNPFFVRKILVCRDLASLAFGSKSPDVSHLARNHSSDIIRNNNRCEGHCFSPESLPIEER